MQVRYYFSQLHLHKGEQLRVAFPHLHFEQSPLQEHLINSLQETDTSGTVIHCGIQACDTLVQPKSSGEGSDCCAIVLVVQIPAW